MTSLKDTPRGINKAELGNFDPCKNHVHLFDPCEGAELWVRWVDVEAAVKELRSRVESWDDRRDDWLEEKFPTNKNDCHSECMYIIDTLMIKLYEEIDSVFGVEK